MALTAFAASVPASARSYGNKHAAFVLDANTGAILHQDDADEQRHPASLTKMMTLYLTFETLEQGRMSMSSKITISQEAASVAPSKLDLEPGEEISVRDAVLALITKSANDVAVALAEKIGGNQKNFVRLMNAKARELGMSKTNFENPSGLPDPEQVTSARDMVTLGLRLQDDFPQYYPLFATRSFSYAGSSHRNHNTLMNNFAGIDGIKTGYTRASGFNLVSSVHRSGRHVVAAVFGGASAATRNAEMRVLLTRALTKASTVKSRKPQPVYVAKLKNDPKRAERPAKPVVVAAQPTAGPPAAPSRPKLIAAPQPVHAPRVAARPEPAALPAPVTEPTPAAAPTSTVAARVASAEPIPGAGAPAPISLTKVRRIMVAPRQAVAVDPSQTTDMDSTDVSADTAASRPANARDSGLPSVSETIVAKTSRSGNAVFAAAAELKPSMLGASEIAAPPQPETPPIAVTPAPAVAAVVAAPQAAVPAKRATVRAAVVPAALTATEPAAKTTAARATITASIRKAAVKSDDTLPDTRLQQIQRGLAPSSLNAQAVALTSGRPGRVASLDPAAGMSGGRFEIQIGAFNSVGEAQKALDAVHTRAGGVVANHASVTQPVDKGGRQIVRARFRGFDATSAARACGALRQQNFDCFVMSAD